MPISDRAGAAPVLLAVLALSACLPTADLLGSASFLAPQALRVSGDEVTIVGPDGYCVDRETARDRRAGSAVILADCGILRGRAAGRDNPAVLTALVSAGVDLPQQPSAAQLERFFRSRAGQAALAHDGTAASVTLLEIAPEGETLYLKLRDRSESRPDDLEDITWRAVFALDDRLVALSVSSHSDRPVGDLTMRRTLEAFVEAVRAANAQSGAAGDA